MLRIVGDDSESVVLLVVAVVGLGVVLMKVDVDEIIGLRVGLDRVLKSWFDAELPESKE